MEDGNIKCKSADNAAERRAALRFPGLPEAGPTSRLTANNLPNPGQERLS